MSREEQREEQYQKMRALRVSLEEKWAEGWGEKTKKAVWDYAWREGHGAGYEEVQFVYLELAEIVNLAQERL